MDVEHWCFFLSCYAKQDKMDRDNPWNGYSVHCFCSIEKQSSTAMEIDAIIDL